MWIQSFLKGRSYKVNIEGSLSKCTPYKCGVPQGSILGPVLFSLYSQDISKIINKYNFGIHVFADDIQIYFESDQNNTRLVELKSCYDEIKDWARKNSLKLNDNKTKYLSISSNRNKSFIQNPFSLQFEPKVKSLGFILDKNLNFSAL